MESYLNLLVFGYALLLFFFVVQSRHCFTRHSICLLHLLWRHTFKKSSLQANLGLSDSNSNGEHLRSPDGSIYYFGLNENEKRLKPSNTRSIKLVPHAWLQQKFKLIICWVLWVLNGFIWSRPKTWYVLSSVLVSATVQKGACEEYSKLKVTAYKK